MLGGISYQRIKHKQALFTSELRQVKGIGEDTAKALYEFIQENF